MSELERFFHFLDLLLTRLTAECRGRPAATKITYRHDHAKILKLLLLAAALGWSLNDLGRKLNHLRNKTYRVLLGLRRSALPHWTTIARRRRSLPFLRFLRRVLRALAKEAILHRPGDLRLVVIDLTPAYRSPLGFRRPMGPRHRGGFYGWKLHLVVNRRGLILGAYLTTAEKRETSCVTTLLVGVWRLLPTRWRKEWIRVVAGDGAYDTNEVHRFGSGCRPKRPSSSTPEPLRQRRPRIGTDSEPFASCTHPKANAPCKNGG